MPGASGGNNRSVVLAQKPAIFHLLRVRQKSNSVALAIERRNPDGGTEGIRRDVRPRSSCSIFFS